MSYARQLRTQCAEPVVTQTAMHDIPTGTIAKIRKTPGGVPSYAVDAILLACNTCQWSQRSARSTLSHRRQTMNETWTVVFIDSDGKTCCSAGPFDTWEEAARYAEDNNPHDHDWFIR
jgi:hypothetical protein